MSNSVLPHASTGGARSGASNRRRDEKRREKLLRVYPAQPIDKSRFGRENPRKSKEIQPSKSGIFAAKRRGPKKIQINAAAGSEREAHNYHILLP